MKVEGCLLSYYDSVLHMTYKFAKETRTTQELNTDTFIDIKFDTRITQLSRESTGIFSVLPLVHSSIFDTTAVSNITVCLKTRG